MAAHSHLNEWGKCGKQKLALLLYLLWASFLCSSLQHEKKKRKENVLKVTAVSLVQVEVKLSVKFTSREFSLKRMPSRKQTGVFGVKIAIVTK